MSKARINQYYKQVEDSFRFSHSRNEQTIRNYFWNLLNYYAEQKHYHVTPEVTTMGTTGVKVRPDGILKNTWGLDIGYWESKDEKDSIDEEINAKFKKGYPRTNILFEDSKTAVLYQRGEEAMRVNMKDADELHALLSTFVAFKSEAVHKFEEALDNFKKDIPAIVNALREKIDAADDEAEFLKVHNAFWELCKAEINPAITAEDIREMMIQHILTADLFQKVFDEPDFHKENNIARELEKLIGTLFDRNTRKNLLHSIEHYYEAINSTAAQITDHHEKQKFLKVLYENFYKVYNPKAADRLGVVYTPNEIVQFMVQSTDYLLEKHFGKTLADKDVEILDPATGTGTFITEILDHIPQSKLAHKYKNEIHCNEVAILPYYVANLNIEYTFKQKMGYYEEFPNACFVDTLDNTGALAYHGKQHDMFGFSSENAERIRRQNSKKISVIIGNPPYNANQLNENENNKNREYPQVDKRIKETFIKHSTAQKTKVYDMYARFYRWAMDRVDKNGIVAFITNRSFIDSRTFDGFRKIIQDNFSNAYIVDTRSDVRANPKIAGTTHNVFGIQTGVAIMFLIRKDERLGDCRIEYVTMEDDWRKEEKLEWLRTNTFQKVEFTRITPDKSNNWINLSDNDWDSLLPLGSKDVKYGKSKEGGVFEMFSNGVVTARDEWVRDFDEANLGKKVKKLIELYNADVIKLRNVEKKDIKNSIDYSFKWSRAVRNDLVKGVKYEYGDKIISSLYRPFVKDKLYFDKDLNEMQNQIPYLFGVNKNVAIAVNGGNEKFASLATDLTFDFALLKFGNGNTQCLPLYRYDANGNRVDNITDWGLQLFVSRYNDKKITKEDIFHYTYAVLHHPAYRKKYELNLKREFPRIPLYDNFKQWVKWGKTLMDLHLNYESTKPFPLKQINQSDEANVSLSPSKTDKQRAKSKLKSTQAVLLHQAAEPEALYAHKPKLKVKLKADKVNGVIELDEETKLTGIPAEAWNYKLGNRSALEWILDQYKEKKPSDPTIAEKFNTYRFADYKDKVIDLLKRVTTVSVETVKVVNEMPEQ